METTTSPPPTSPPEGGEDGGLDDRFYPARITRVEADTGGAASPEGRVRRIRVLFDDGACRLFDLGPYLDRPVFERLRGEGYFVRVAPSGPYAVAWPEGEDLSAGMIYHEGEPCSPPPSSSPEGGEHAAAEHTDDPSSATRGAAGARGGPPRAGRPRTRRDRI